MFDLTFHALEYAAYQPDLFRSQHGTDARQSDPPVQSARYQSLPPVSPRASLLQPIARLINRVLNAIQDLVANLQPRASAARGTSGEASAGNRSDGSAAGTAGAPAHQDDAAMKTAYLSACEDSLRALEDMARAHEPVDVFTNLEEFCECRGRIASLALQDNVLPQFSTEQYLATLKTLKTLVTLDTLTKLKACKKAIERQYKSDKPSAEEKQRLHYRWSVVANLIEFAQSDKVPLMCMKPGFPIS